MSSLPRTPCLIVRVGELLLSIQWVNGVYPAYWLKNRKVPRVITTPMIQFTCRTFWDFSIYSVENCFVFFFFPSTLIQKLRLLLQQMKKLRPFFTSLLSEYHATKVLSITPQERHGIFISGLPFISCVIFGSEKLTHPFLCGTFTVISTCSLSLKSRLSQSDKEEQTWKPSQGTPGKYTEDFEWPYHLEFPRQGEAL